MTARGLAALPPDGGQAAPPSARSLRCSMEGRLLADVSGETLPFSKLPQRDTAAPKEEMYGVRRLAS